MFTRKFPNKNTEKQHDITIYVKCKYDVIKTKQREVKIQQSKHKKHKPHDTKNKINFFFLNLIIGKHNQEKKE